LEHAWHLDWRLLPVLDSIGSTKPYAGAYSFSLVATSVLIAILASFVAFSISARVSAATTQWARLAWTGAGAISMGGGIWAMHFIGMLAFSLPCGITYNPFGTMLSMIPGMVGSGVALNIVGRSRTPTLVTLGVAAALMGGGIGAMHYSGMAAVQADALLRYNPLLLLLSVGVAVGLAFVSLGIRFWLLSSRSKIYATLIASCVMGCAVAGMHYTAMQASMFFPIEDALVRSGMVVPPTLLAMLIALFVGLIVACTMVASFAGQQNELAHTLKLEIASGSRARAEAETANAAKSQFLATMSHEIRTPLNGIMGMANLLSLTAVSGRQRKLVENLERSGQSLLGVINDILDFSKIEAGRFELFEVDFDLREMISDVSDLFSERCSSAGLEFISYVDDDVPSHLRGDPVRLRQILVNLIGNAMKFTERGEVLLRVMTECRTDEHVVLACFVEDTGIGIAEKEQPKLFQSFVQLDGSMTRARGGSGLGLVITKQLVELMGGQIGFESKVGRGSKFYFNVRMASSLLNETSKRPSQCFPATFRVLAVDSNVASAAVLARYFASWNIPASIVGSIDEARSLWKTSKDGIAVFSVAVIDAKGFGDEGITLAEDIQKECGGDSGKVIILASLGAVIGDARLNALGAAAVLSKPPRPSELYECLAKLATNLDRTGAAAFSQRRNSREKRLSFKGTVLVAEDNSVNREVVTGILESMGIRVVSAPNGRVAVEMFEAQNFDAVLMDCEMPILDGLEATRRLRQYESRRAEADCATEPRSRTPIVALTAHALTDVRERCLRAGMDDFLTKPFNDIQMGEVLRRWLKPVDRENVTRQDGSVSSAPAAIDTSAFSEIGAFQGSKGRARLTQIMSRFLDEAPALTASIHAAHADGSAESLSRAAHSLKSSSAVMGAQRLSERCAMIETLARDHGPSAVTQHLSELDAELGAAVHGLRRFMDNAEAKIDA
jgi:signal transduction histidine kinase/DNA-binding response OmpR family regulator/HPt (histidine-containing phosphotransfer) domain-containing protein